jgi:GNAT superfamily N-acetyltransferase
VSVLDNPVWSALTGPQSALGTATPLAARFHREVSPFGGLAGAATRAHWDDLADLAGPAGVVGLVGSGGGMEPPPTGWAIMREITGVQMVGNRVGPGPTRSGPSGSFPTDRPTDTPVRLGEDDVPDMLVLVAETQPGPFLPRTVEFGGYLGIRREGRLVAMAGERLRPPGYAEISAVATDPGHRRQGLAELLIRAVGAGIAGRGEVPFLHASSTNTGAIRLYEAMGFTLRRTVTFLVVEAPGHG